MSTEIELTKKDYFEQVSLHTRQLESWAPPLLPVETQHRRIRDVAAGRARTLVDENAIGSNGRRIHLDSVIGPSFKLSVRPDPETLGVPPETAHKWAKLVESRWEAYAQSPTFDCDASRSRTFPFLMQAAYSSLFVNGEMLGVFKEKRSLTTGAITCLLLVEHERLSQPDGKEETRNFRRGIERDNDGAPIAYWIRKGHPRDWVAYDFSVPEWSREKAYTSWGRPRVLHVIDRHRPDQIRGLSRFLTVDRKLKHLDTHQDAELEAAMLQAGFAATITTELQRDDAMNLMGGVNLDAIRAAEKGFWGEKSLAYMDAVAGYHSANAITVNGAKLVHLLPGEKMEMVKPEHPGLNFEAFQNHVMRYAAAGLGVSYEELTRDFSKVSYAAAMMSIRSSWQHFMNCRQQVISYIALPHFFAWLEEEIDEGFIPLPSGKKGSMDDLPELRNALAPHTTFMAAGAPKIDPVKDIKADQLALTSGIKTLQQICAEQGVNWESQLEQIAREREMRKKLDIPQPEEVSESGGGNPFGEEEQRGETDEGSKTKTKPKPK